MSGVGIDAVRRLRQIGWRAAADHLTHVDDVGSGTYIAAALVPRCQKPRRVLGRYLAIRMSSDQATTTPSEVEIS
jgi:hypothetical protein